MADMVWAHSRRGSRLMTKAVVVTALLVAAFCQFLPIYHFVNCFSPAWITMVLIYVMRRQVIVCQPWLFFMVGLLEDMLYQVSLGVHAFSLLLLYALLNRYKSSTYRRERLLGESLQVFVLVLLQQIMIMITTLCLHQQAWSFVFFTQSILSSLLWPLVVMLLNASLQCFSGHMR